MNQVIGVAKFIEDALRLYHELEEAALNPEGVAIRIFPLPTPVGGIPEYPLQEIRGLLNYRFITNPPITVDTPYPYKH